MMTLSFEVFLSSLNPTAFLSLLGAIVPVAKPSISYYSLRGQARQKFVDLFLDELRKSSVDDRKIDHRKYKKHIKQLFSNPDVKKLLLLYDRLMEMDATQIAPEIKKIWDHKYDPSQVSLPPAIDWDVTIGDPGDLKAYIEDLIVDWIERSWTKKCQPSEVAFPGEFNWKSLIKDYQKAVKDLRIRDSIEGPAAIVKDKETDGPISPGLDRDKYQKSLENSYSDLTLKTLNFTSSKYKIKLWDMFIKQNVCEGLPPSQFEIPQDCKQALIAGQLDTDAIRSKDCKYAVVVGNPGSGKSTLLQHLALEWTKDNMEPFPLLIELQKYVRSGAKTFLDFLHGSGNAHYPLGRYQLDKYLQNNPSLVMFDGLDEVVNREKYEIVVKQIANFAKEYTEAKIIVTSRVVGYDDERLERANFQHFTLQELDRNQIEKFIDKWYDLALGEDPEKEPLKQRLKEAIANSPAIANLADNPMLLTMMAIFNRRESLPKDRAKLYDQASQVLLYDWDEKKNLDPKIKKNIAQKILQKIAYEMQSDQKELAANLIDREELEKILTDHLESGRLGTPSEIADILIDQLRTRNYIFCDRREDTYGFVHNTFLKYFCAKEIVHKFDKEHSLSLEQLQDEIFGRHWQDKAWHEVLKLICGLLKPKDAGKLVDFLIGQKVDRSAHPDDDCAKEEASQHLELVIECFAEIRSPQSTWLQNFAALQKKNRLVSLLLKSRGKHHTEPEILKFLKEFAALHDQDKWLQRAAVERIAKDHHNEETLKWLKEFAALHNQDGAVRRAAVESIGEYYHTEETLTWLKYFAALHDQNELVRRAAVESIGEYYHTEETLKWLKDFAAPQDRDGFVRWVAVESIGEYYHTEPETRTWLQNTALHDRDGFVRWAAVVSIVEYYIQADGIFELLCQIASQDPYQSISEYYIQADGIFELLCQIASQDISQDDSYFNPRQTALEALVKHYIDRPEVIELLRDRSTQDPDEELRKWAEERLKNID